MYDGKQVLRFVTNYKSKDLYNIGNEMTKRIGTGNYDKERTKFNIHYKDIKRYNLYQEVKSHLNDNNVEYLNKTKTNMLNGVTITSGPEFFQTLGMEFIESDRVYQSGNKKGQNVMIPNIKNKEDIPNEVKRYFDCCYEFIKNTFGEENIIMAQVHYDEDTPHLQAYFLPIVNEVKRKVFEKDTEGSVIKELVKGIDGSEKIVPKLKRDSNGKIVYETVKGKFLNNDQLWKDLGGKTSFATLQNSFNKYMTEKDFRLDRGKIGSNKVHTDKLDFKKEELQAELYNLENDIKQAETKLNTFKDNIENKINIDDITLKKGITGYNSKDVEKLIDFSTNLKQLNSITKYQLESEQRKNFSLNMENDYYKNNKELINMKRDNYQNHLNFKDLKNDNAFLQKGFNEIARALSNTLKIKPLNNFTSYIKLAREINKSNSHINDEMNQASKEFSKLFDNNEL